MGVSAVFFAELIGTMLLVLLGNGSVAANLLAKSKWNGSGGALHINAGWGFAVMVGAMSTAWISGAHLNPAVTIGLYAIGLFDGGLVGVYIVAQFLGAALGAVLVYLTYKKQYDETTDSGLILATFSTGPEVRSGFWNAITEVIGTAVLLFGILAITNSNNMIMSFGPFLVGLLVWGIGISLGGPTGYAINPARDLGPRIIHALLPLKNKGASNWGYAWVPVVAPLIGGVLGALVYKGMVGFAG